MPQSSDKGLLLFVISTPPPALDDPVQIMATYTHLCISFGEIQFFVHF